MLSGVPSIVSQVVHRVREQGVNCIMLVMSNDMAGLSRAVTTEVAVQLGSDTRSIPWVPTDTRLCLPRMASYISPSLIVDPTHQRIVLMHTDWFDIEHVLQNLKGGCAKLCRALQQLQGACACTCACPGRRVLIFTCVEHEMTPRALLTIMHAVGEAGVMRVGAGPTGPTVASRPGRISNRACSSAEQARRAGVASRVARLALVASLLECHAAGNPYEDSLSLLVAEALRQGSEKLCLTAVDF
jgi:hypothetical protein